MKLKKLAILVILGMTMSVGFAATDVAQLFDDTKEGQDRVVFKSDTYFAGSNAIESPSGITAAVPEPSVTALAALGLLGFATLKLRRRRR